MWLSYFNKLDIYYICVVSKFLLNDHLNVKIKAIHYFIPRPFEFAHMLISLHTGTNLHACKLSAHELYF